MNQLPSTPLWTQFLNHYPARSLDWASAVLAGELVHPLVVEAIPRTGGYTAFWQALGLLVPTCCCDPYIYCTFNSGLERYRVATTEEVQLPPTWNNSRWLTINRKGEMPLQIENRIAFITCKDTGDPEQTKVMFDRVKLPVTNIVQKLRAELIEKGAL